jgi:PilZ domain
VEKRQHPRIDCRIESTLRIAQQEFAAVVRNVSEGGLAVQAAVEPTERGEMAYLKLQPGRGPEIELAVLLWHFKKLRKVSTGESVTQMGVVLASGSEPYFDLVRRLQKRADAANVDLPVQRRARPAEPAKAAAPEPARAAAAGPARAPAAEAAKAPAPEPREAPAAETKPNQQYAIRVKQRGGSRSCKLVVGGASVEDAKEKALAEIGAGWTVLEAKLL